MIINNSFKIYTLSFGNIIRSRSLRFINITKTLTLILLVFKGRNGKNNHGKLNQGHFLCPEDFKKTHFETIRILRQEAVLSFLCKFGIKLRKFTSGLLLFDHIGPF